MFRALRSAEGRRQQGRFDVKKADTKEIQTERMDHPNDMDTGQYTTNKVEATRRRSRALRQEASAIRAEARKIVGQVVATVKQHSPESTGKTRKAA